MPFEVPVRIASAVPDAGLVAQIRARFAASATPVRPLPSNAAMMAGCVGVCVAVAIVLAANFGFQGFGKLSGGPMAVEYSMFLLLAFVLAGIAVEQAIPGSRRVLQPVAGAALALALLSRTALLLFPDFAGDDFVSRGVPCLRLGVLCALPAAALTGAMMRRGYVTDARQASIAGGALSGLLGFGVLALHCPILNAAHIVAWHIAVIAVTTLVGALFGWVLRWLP